MLSRCHVLLLFVRLIESNQIPVTNGDGFSPLLRLSVGARATVARRSKLHITSALTTLHSSLLSRCMLRINVQVLLTTPHSATAAKFTSIAQLPTVLSCATAWDMAEIPVWSMHAYTYINKIRHLLSQRRYLQVADKCSICDYRACISSGWVSQVGSRTSRNFFVHWTVTDLECFASSERFEACTAGNSIISHSFKK